MNRKMSHLKKSIESIREQLHKLARDKGLADHEVIYYSQKLDQLLNEYNQQLQSFVTKQA